MTTCKDISGMIIRKPKKLDYLMTHVAVVVAKDRIVALADGRAEDEETKELRDDVPKIFKLTSTSVVLITGRVMDGMEARFDTAAYAIKKANLKTVEEVTEWLEGLIADFKWDFGHFSAIVVGFDGNIPRINYLQNGQKTEAINPKAFGAGALGHNIIGIDLLDEISSWPTSYNRAEVALMNGLKKAERLEPRKVGGIIQIWHISPNGIDEKPESYGKKLRERLA